MWVSLGVPRRNRSGGAYFHGSFPISSDFERIRRAHGPRVEGTVPLCAFRAVALAIIQTNLTRDGFAAAAAAIVEWDRPANVSVSPDESVIVVDDVPPVECMSSAARSADWLISAFR